MLHSWSQVAPMTGPSTRSKLFKEEAGSKYPDWAGSTLVRSTLWGLNTLKIENTSSATPQPASTYDINWKNRRWFSGKLNDWLWPWGQCHWDSDYLEISSRYTNLKILRCLIHELSHSQPCLAGWRQYTVSLLHLTRRLSKVWHALSFLWHKQSKMLLLFQLKIIISIFVSAVLNFLFTLHLIGWLKIWDSCQI